MKNLNPVFICILFIAFGIIGTILGDAFSSYLPMLKYGDSIGFGPAVLDLKIFTLTFGFSFDLTVAGIIGIIVALIVYKRI